MQPAERVHVEHVSSHCVKQVLSVRLQLDRQPAPPPPVHRIAHCCSCCVHVVAQSLAEERHAGDGVHDDASTDPSEGVPSFAPLSAVPASSAGSVGPVGSAATSSDAPSGGRVPFGESALAARLASA